MKAFSKFVMALALISAGSLSAAAVPSCFVEDQKNRIVDGSFIIGFDDSKMSGEEVFEALADLQRITHARDVRVLGFGSAVMQADTRLRIARPKFKQNINKSLAKYVKKYDRFVKYVECNGIVQAFR